MLDRLGREIDYVRISITDRCNLRCVYCMPEHGVASMRHEDVLSYEEILRTVRACCAGDPSCARHRWGADGAAALPHAD